MSNVSISHKIPIFGLLRENIYWILFEYLFLLQRTWFSSSTSQTQPSKCLHYNSFLRPTRSTILQGHICNYQLDIYTRVLKHFKLYITKTQLTFLLICLFSSMMEKQQSTLQNLTPSLSRALCNCSCTLPSSLPFCCCIDPCYFFPMTGVTLLIPMPSLQGPILNTARAIF